MAARLRTLPAAVAPVLVGTALADELGDDFRPGTFVAALLGAIFIQVGTNLSNDYSDARRGADTEDRLGPVRVTAGGLVPPKQVLMATYVTFGLAVAVRRLPHRGRRARAAVRRRRVDRGGRALHGRPQAVRLRGPRRGLRVPVLRGRRGRRLDVRPGRGVAGGGVRPGGARSGCSRPRSSSSTTSATWTPTGARASARSPCGSAASAARLLYGAMVFGAFVVAPLPWLLGPLSPWLLLCWLTLPLAVRLVRTVREHADGPTLNEALAQTGPAAARVLPAAERGHPRRLRPCESRSRSAASRLRTPLETSYGPVASRAIFELVIEGADGVAGRGEARRSSPTTASRSIVRAPRWRPTAPVLSDGDGLDGGELLDACRAARRPPAGAGRGRPRAVGSRRAPGGDAGRGAARRHGAGARSRSTRRSARATARARPRRPRPRWRRASRCVKLKVGVGDDAGRVAAVRAALGPGVRLRLDANGAWTVRGGGADDRRARAGGARARRGARPRARPRCARCASGSPCGSRWTRRPPSRARSPPAPPTRSA